MLEECWDKTSNIMMMACSTGLRRCRDSQLMPGAGYDREAYLMEVSRQSLKLRSSESSQDALSDTGRSKSSVVPEAIYMYEKQPKDIDRESICFNEYIQPIKSI